MAAHILIVDDDKGVQFLHEIIVLQSRVSIKPLSFNDGEKAYNYLDQNWNETDTYLILLDINMPVMNGWNFLDTINYKSYNRKVHVVVVTSSIDRADREKAKLYEQVIGFIEKPVTDEIFERILNLSIIAASFI